MMLGPDKVCAVVAASDARLMLRQLRRALRRTRTVELRIDWLQDDQEISHFLKRLAAQRPQATLIATCRRREAGGQYRGSIAQQLVLLAEAIQAGCSWYDLEIETIRRCPRELLEVLLGDGRRLASAHFFGGMPASLARVHRELWRNRPEAIKIAAQCNSLADACKLIQFGQKERKAVVIPMGEVALPVRILALKEKNSFAYAPVENETAPGQVSLDKLKDLYRADRLDRRTRVYGLVGNPVGHSLSPLIQNAGFAARRVNAIYAPFLVRDLKDFVAAIPRLRIRGFSVTIPHKQNILKYLDGCDPLAEKIGAVNTVAVDNRGKLYGYNTDYVGVLRSLEQRLTLAGSRVLILGAGGAARAVAFALAQAGSSVCIWARRPASAKLLARDAGCQTIERSDLKREFFDVIVNATPVGMYPLVGDSPLTERELNCRLVFDTIYRPRRTRLIRLAARKGIETISGVEMFVAQGAAQWEIWTGKRAPVAVMRKALLDAFAQEERTRSQAKR